MSQPTDTEPHTDDAGVADASHAVAGMLLAAGSSSRMGGNDKLLADLGGVSVVRRSMRMFADAQEVCCVAVITNPDNADAVAAEVASDGRRVRLVYGSGGERRQDSVRNGLGLLDATGCTADVVAVHDAARPLATSQLLDAGARIALRAGAAVPVVPVRDSLKRLDAGVVAESLDRAAVVASQTPQVFRRDVLDAAHASVNADVTDDAQLVETAGGIVATFPGDVRNIKLTDPTDLAVARALADDASSGQPTTRHGIGYDVHRLSPGGNLRLGGVEIEFDRHLEGHSDGDALLHAVASAILGAGNLGDLGQHFPSSDAQYAGLASAHFVEQSIALLTQRGWGVDYLDATVIAARPRIAPHYAAVSASIAAIAGIDREQVSVKATTTDGVGIIGAEDAIGAQAVATVSRV